ncbi:hypothetical protein GGR51DRAFT_49689 [Nemania sp. FL0031]|nr:hypothetical protein GGR51DRAFT_49689 [Nemania sp. FL0031]
MTKASVRAWRPTKDTPSPGKPTSIMIMAPTTTEKQGNRDGPAQVDTTPGPRQQPPDELVVHSIASPAISNTRERDDASPLAGMTPGLRSATHTPVADPVTPQKQKSPNSLSPLTTEHESPSRLESSIRQDLVIKFLVEDLLPALRKLVENCACILGCKVSFNIHFRLATSEIRKRLSPLPSATAKDIADEVVDVVLSA